LAEFDTITGGLDPAGEQLDGVGVERVRCVSPQPQHLLVLLELQSGRTRGPCVLHHPVYLAGRKY
jgi:hypothetical protein